MINGMSISEASRQSNITKTALKVWLDEAKRTLGAEIVNPAVAAKNRYLETLENLIVATHEMEIAAAEVMSDPEFIKELIRAKPNEYLIVAESISKRTRGAIEFERQRVARCESLPAPAELVNAEIVDA